MRWLGTSLAVAALLTVPSWTQAGPHAAPARPVTNPKVAAALRTLEDIEAQTERASRDVRMVRRQAEERPKQRADAREKGPGTTFAPPRSLVHRIGRIGAHVEATLRPLRLQPWAEVEPALRKAERLRGRLRRIGETLAAPVTPRAKPVRSRRDPAAAGSGRITGHVTDARNGAPLDATVMLYDASGMQLDSYPAAGGSYAMDGLGSGTYFLRADTSGPDYIGELYNDLPCDWYCNVTAGTPVTVLDGQTTPSIDFALLPFSTISGTVLDATTEQPRQGVDVSLVDAQGNTFDWTTTGADGSYLFPEVTAGIYFTVAEDPYYLDQLYSGIPCQPACSPLSGTPILVGPAADVRGIDFQMQLGGSISGTVTDEMSGDPIDGYVGLFDASGGWIGYTAVGSTGQYQAFDLTTGNYFATIHTWPSDYAGELYDDLPCEPSCVVTNGTPIAVTQGQEHGAVSFALVPLTGGIAGTVSDAATGAPISATSVSIVDASGLWRGNGYTSSTGNYRVRGLLAGSYFVYTADDTYVDELYDNLLCDPTCVPMAGTPVVVTAGADAVHVDFALALGGWITGHVLSTAGTPIACDVDVYRSDGTSVGYGTYTDETGEYAMRGLVTGSYFALARDYGGLEILPELYRELPCPSGCDPTSGTPIAVTTGQASAGIDFTPNRLGRISGRLTEAGTGLPVNTSVNVYRQGGGLQAYWVTGDGMGHYVVGGLPAGTYFVWTDSWYDRNYVDQLYANKTCEPSCDVTQGTPVTVALDATTNGIDFALRGPTFADVPVDHWAWKWVEAAYAAGLTGGCATGPLRFCPDAAVTRDQSAVVLLRAKDGPTYVPPPATGVFQDVPVSNGFAPWVEELVRRGVTTGCSTNPPLFCPANSVTRAQSAPFLLRTHDGATYLPPPAVGVFADVPASDPFARWVEELVRRGVTAGCSTSPSLFCPGSSVTRAQFSVFLGKTFGLTLP